MQTFLLLFSTGETILILFILAFSALIPLIIIGFVFFKLRSNKKNLNNFGQFAPQFGLQMPNPKSPKLKGFYNDCEVEVALSSRRVGSGEDSSTEYFTYCEAYFPNSLRFLLDISCPQGWFSRTLNSNDIKLGQPSFDNKYSLKCYDGEIARRLLLSDFPSNNTQNLMGDLMRASETITYIDITDREVYTEETGHFSDMNKIKQMLDVTTYLAKRFKAARESFPLADWEKQLFANWQKIANENNLQFDSQEVQMQGNYKNFPIFVALKTDKGKWQTQIKIKFPNSLMIGLKLMPENSIHKALSWLGVQDIKVGIKAFDDAFIVKGKNIQMAKHKLQPNVCNQLVALSRTSSDLLIDDESMSFTFDTVLGDEKKLKSFIEGMISTSKMLLQ